MREMPRAFGPFVDLEERDFDSVVTVYDGRHARTGQRVTIEVLEGGARSQAYRRKLAAAASVSHPGIAAVIDAGTSGDSLYVVHAYLEGEPLARRLRHRESLSAAERLDMLSQAAAGLEHAHSRGAVHSRLSPEHLWLVADGRLQITGLSLPAAAFQDLNDAGDPSAGGPLYQAPEQIRGRDAGPATDVFSFAVLVYELLSSRHPFRGATPATILRMHDREPPPLDEAWLGCPHELSVVVGRCLSQDPEQRPELAELSERLRDLRLRDGRRPLGVEAVASVPPEKPATAPYLDDNVQFTVYRPRTVEPGRWIPLPAFAHLDEKPASAGADEEDPLDVVQRQARQLLGSDLDDYLERSADSARAIPREGEITFVPEMPGVEFRPRSQTFPWVDSVHPAHFRLRASNRLDGQTARGRMSVYLGAILLAELSLSFRVRRQAGGVEPRPDAVSVRPFSKIFASYSHADMAIVEQFERYAAALGDRYLRDWVDLRAGEKWSPALRELIATADVFQLFWSANAARSELVRREWQFALNLNRERFIRPCCWQRPFPPPPPELDSVHFKAIDLGAASRLEEGSDPVPPPPAPHEGGANPLIFHLEHLIGARTGQSQPVALRDGQAIRLGRRSGNDVRLSDDNVSSVHAVLGFEGGRFWVEDQRSTNGTFLDDTPCPPFERIAVPGGSRIRLARNGPEMRITFQRPAATGASPPPAPSLPPGQPAPRRTRLESSSTAPRASHPPSPAGPGATPPPSPAGPRATQPPPAAERPAPPPESAATRQTQVREIDRAGKEGRKRSRKPRISRLLLAAIAPLALVLLAVTSLRTHWHEMLESGINRGPASPAGTEELTPTDGGLAPGPTVGSEPGAPWSTIEQLVRPSVAHVRCRFHVERASAGETVRTETVEITGSAVLIRPELLLTSRLVVEPWELAIDGQDTEANRLTAVYESLEVQLPGYPPVTATVTAVSEGSGLALLSVPEMKLTPIPLAAPDRATRVTDQVAVAGYPADLDERILALLDPGSAAPAPAPPPSRGAEPGFQRTVVIRSAPATGESPGYLYLDATAAPGSAGGPVVNERGEVAGIVSPRLAPGETLEIGGVTYTTLKEAKAPARAVDLAEIVEFLSRVGVL